MVHSMVIVPCLWCRQVAIMYLNLYICTCRWKSQHHGRAHMSICLIGRSDLRYTFPRIQSAELGKMPGSYCVMHSMQSSKAVLGSAMHVCTNVSFRHAWYPMLRRTCYAEKYVDCLVVISPSLQPLSSNAAFHTSLSILCTGMSIKVP